MEFSSLNILDSKPCCANHLGAGCKSICLNPFHRTERLALKWDSLRDSEGKSVAVTWGERFRTAGVLDGIAFKCTTALAGVDRFNAPNVVLYSRKCDSLHEALSGSCSVSELLLDIKGARALFRVFF